MSLHPRVKLGTFLAAFCLVLWGAPSAIAQESGALYYESQPVYWGGVLVGTVAWNSDPSGSYPGDAMMVCDQESDGWAIEAELYRPGSGLVEREASTRGHNAVYCTPWITGDLPENVAWNIQINMVRGTESRDRGTMYVTS